MTWFYNLIIGAGGMIIGILTFLDEVANKFRVLNFLKSLIIKIPFFLLGSAMIIWASIQKDNDTEDINENERIAHANEIRTINNTYRLEKSFSDSLNNKKIQQILDSSYLKSIKASNEALAKYNLVIIDSLHKVASTINSKTLDPQLSVASAGNGIVPIRIAKSADLNELQIKFVSANATSYAIKINYYILKAGSLIDILQSGVLIPGEKFIVPNINTTTSIQLLPKTLMQDSILIILTGEFSKDREGKIIIPYKQSFNFNIHDNSFYEILGINYQNIIKYKPNPEY